MACSLLFAALGCAAPHVILDKGIIRNETQGSIFDVEVRHEPTGKTAKTNRILPASTFDLGFSGQPMLGRHATVTWKESDGRERKEELNLPDNRELKSDRGNKILVYIIHPSGKVSAHLQNSDTRK
jgi:hypothetical protein